MPILLVVAALAAVAWLYLLTGHGGFWRTDCRLPGGAGRPGEPPWLTSKRPPPSKPPPSKPPPSKPPPSKPPPSRPPPSKLWPTVVAVVPARDEAAILPVTLPTLLGQEYPGEFSVVLVDDDSTDGTGEIAARLGRAEPTCASPTRADPTRADPTRADPTRASPTCATPGRGTTAGLTVIAGSPTPAGWAGKVWAMAQGVSAAGECDYLLFTDSDIAFQPGALASLVTAAVSDDRALVSQMALLRTESGWERWIVPAFVYFFAQLYPFRRVGRTRSRIAAAAGGCMLVHRETLTAAGGLAGIAAARIDDVALGRLLKRGPAKARCWLGFTTQVRSRRPYPGLSALWDMVARSAYTQLRYSPTLLAGTVAGLLWLYLLPPVAALAGLAALAAGGGITAGWAAAAGMAGWAVMAASYLPVLRLYRLSWLRAPILPLIALLYAGMTVDSARRHYAGRGGEWKGRIIPTSRGAL